MNRKNRSFYYLILVCGWTILLFHLSSMSYMDQDIRPYLRLMLKEEMIHQWFSAIEFSYNGERISIGNLGEYAFLEFFIRKGAHLFFYGMLGFVLARYFAGISGIKKAKVLLLSFCMLFIIAGLDEYIQHLHPHRSGQWVDVWLDCAGGAAGIIGGFLSAFTSSSRKKSANLSM